MNRLLWVLPCSSRDLLAVARVTAKLSIIDGSYWGFPGSAAFKNSPAMQETGFDCWVGKIRWRRDRLPTPAFLGFPCGSAGKESACSAGHLGWIPGLGRPPGGGHGNSLKYSGLENSMNRGAWRATVHVVAKSETGLSCFHFRRTLII